MTCNFLVTPNVMKLANKIFTHFQWCHLYYLRIKKNCCSITLCILIFNTTALIITFLWMSQFKTSMPSVVKLSVVMQNVVMVSVAARLEWLAVADIWKIYRTEMEGENSEITKRNKMLNGGTLSRKSISYCGIHFFKFHSHFWFNFVHFCILSVNKIIYHFKSKFF